MSTPNFSNFISNFTDLSNIDIVSSVSDRITLIASPNATAQQYGRYFCIGDLLIQFSSNDSTISNQTTGAYTLPFPYTYDSTPYTVMLTPTDNGNGNRVNVTLQSFNKSGFSFELINNNGWCTFIAIGPRPSALYTA